MRRHALTASVTLWLQALGVFAHQKPITGTHGGNGPSSPFTSDFGDFVQDLLEEWHVAGTAIGVIDGDDVFAQGYGIATLPDTEATPDTLWYVGSTTKAQTAATLAKLIDSGEYPALSRGWRTPISSILGDDFVVQDDWSTAHLTLEDAVSHRTGFTRHDATLALWYNGSDDSNGMIRQTVRNLRNLPLQLEPRVEFHYCNLMYLVLSHVIETVTGKWLGDVLREQIWEPLGMNSTFFDLQQAQDSPEHLSTGYFWHNKDEKLKPMSFMPTDVVSGAGAAISNVVDYTKWIKSLLRKGKPFTKAVHQDIRKPRMVETPEPGLGMDVVLYSLGWFRTNLYGQVAYSHPGSTVTHGTLVYWFPELDYGVVMFTNYASPIRDVVVRRLIEDKLNIPESKRYDMNKEMRDQKETTQRDIADAVNVLFPNRPKSPLPSTLKTSDLAGKYRHSGYGPVELREKPHPTNENQTILVTGDDDELHHVTGDFWVLYLIDGNGPAGFYSAQFAVGVDGKAASLAVDVFDRREMVDEGTIVYLRDE